MKIRLCVHRKAGAPEFGSDGIGGEMELDLDQAIIQTPDAVRECFRSHYALLKSIVADELAGLQKQRTQGRPAEPERRPARDQADDSEEPRRNGHRSNGTARSGNGDGRDDDAPRDGRQLLGWARKNNADVDLLRIGRKWKLPPRVIQWERSEVEDVYRELLAQPVGGGRRSG